MALIGASLLANSVKSPLNALFVSSSLLVNCLAGSAGVLAGKKGRSCGKVTILNFLASLVMWLLVEELQ